jgi:tRNA-dihydrouridine synthase B
MLDWSSMDKPIIGLAPMADYTDTPFTLVCKRIGGLRIAFREMISAEAIIRGNEKTFAMAQIEDEERPVVQQIFGSDPSVMAEAARVIAERCRPDAIDINMGCPVRKLVSNFDGASLMRDPERAVAIVRAVKSAVDLPVSVKTRLGWDDDRSCLEFVPRLEAAGADLVTIHGRTRAQGYAGTANWDRVGEAAKRVSIPVLVNGDIVSGATAADAIRRANAAGCLIGRAAVGNPWIFKEIGSALSPVANPPSAPPALADRISAARLHARLVYEREGDRGMLGLRKHLASYFKGIEGAKEMRSRLVRTSSYQEVEGILKTTTILLQPDL